MTIVVRSQLLKVILGVAVCWGWMAVAEKSAQPADLTISLEPSNTPPTEILLIPSGGVPAPLTPGSTSGTYHGDAPSAPPPAYVENYVVVARWPRVNQQLYLRVTNNTPSNIILRIFNKHPPADVRTLDRIESLGKDLMSQLEKYFVSRDVYRALSDPKLAVRRRAFRDWYDAAFLLSRDYAYIAPDDEVIELANNESTTYFINMNKQYLALEWADVGLIKTYAEQGDGRKALNINEYFKAKFTSLPKDMQAAVEQNQKINLDLLNKNADYLNAIVK